MYPVAVEYLLSAVMDSGRPQGAGQGVAGDSIVLEEEIDQNYVPSEVNPSEFLFFSFVSIFLSLFSSLFLDRRDTADSRPPLHAYHMTPAGRGARVREMARNGVGR